MANSAVHNKNTFHAGDTIDVHYKLIEKEKVAGKAKKEVKEEVRERVQVFEGIVIKIKGEGENKSFTVRKIGAAAIGVERIFPLSSPWIKKIVVKKKGSVRRAKLYYLRNLVGRQADKLKEKAMTKEEKDLNLKIAREKTSVEQKPENTPSSNEETK